MSLSPGQIDDYGRDGYVVVRGAVPEGQVDRLRLAADEFAADAETLETNTAAIELDDTASAKLGHGVIRRM